MNFETFKATYQKVPVIEYPNNRNDKLAPVVIKVVTYNHADYIRKCLDSVLMQKTNFDFEILIAEDDSNDGTREICIEYAQKHPDRIRLLLNSRANNIFINGSPSPIFNNTYANFLIHSSYHGLIEGDDYWLDETSLQQRYDFLETNPDFVMCFHNIQILENNTIINTKAVKYSKNTVLTPEEMICANIPTNTILQRTPKEYIFEKSMLKIVCGDMVSRGKNSLRGKAMYLHNIKSSIYRKHLGGIFSKKSVSYRFEHATIAAKYICDYYEQHNQNTKMVYSNLVQLHWVYFLIGIKEEKKCNLKLIKEGLSIAKRQNISFCNLILRDLYIRFLLK